MAAATKQGRKAAEAFSTRLKTGDMVLVLSGGNSKKGRVLAGKVGKVLRFLPKTQRVVVEGVNMVKRHKRAMTSADSAGIIEREGSVHISNVMYYHAESKTAVRLVSRKLEDGRKVRGFVNKKTNQFEQIDA